MMNQKKRNRPRVSLSCRKRAIKACTPCRLRKSKCRFTSGDACQNCRNNNLRCFFDLVKKEGITAEDDTLLFGDNTADTPLCSVLRNFNKFFPSVSLTRRHLAFLLQLIAENSHHSPAGSSDNITPGQPTLTHPGGTSRLSNEGFLALAVEVVSQANTDIRQLDASLMVSHLYYDIHINYDHAPLLPVLNQFPNQSEANSLIDTFFSVGQGNCYFLHEDSLRARVSEIYHTKPNWPQDLKFVGLALITFAIASQYPCVKDNCDETGLPGEVYFKSFQRLLPNILAEPSLESIQSCLLMAAYLLPIYGTKISHIYIHQAMRIAISLGLHQENTNKSFPIPLREVCNRVFWTAYINERYIARDLGYPEVIPLADVTCPTPQQMLDLDERDSRQISRLIARKDLVLLSEHVLNLRKGPTDPNDFRTACSRLQYWKRTLHPDLQRLDAEYMRANTHLQIHYHLCWINLGQVDLMKAMQMYLGGQQGGDNIAEAKKSDAPSMTLLASCVDSAYKILDLIERLRQWQKLETFSHTDFYACLIATTVVLLDSIIHPHKKAASRVSMALVALRYIAAGNNHTRKGLDYIEGLLDETNRVLFDFCSPESYHDITGGTSLGR
ncbi:fungal-specific transcription factor domain-containing protein [Mariannaea sp. PMI_226]|nr:fungal-specific transcription factor domain-containing protein [Mariannaea sp. PMI_226]